MRVKLDEGQCSGSGSNKTEPADLTFLPGGCPIRTRPESWVSLGSGSPPGPSTRATCRTFPSPSPPASSVCTAGRVKMRSRDGKNPETHQGFKPAAPQGGAAALQSCPGPRPTPSASPAWRRPATASGGFGAATTRCGGPASPT